MCKNAFERDNFCGKLHTRPAVDRMVAPKARTKYKPEGIGLGAYVTGTGSWSHVSGQVWSKGNGPRSWWVATGQHYVMLHESNLALVGHAQEDEPYSMLDLATG